MIIIVAEEDKWLCVVDVPGRERVRLPLTGFQLHAYLIPKAEASCENSYLYLTMYLNMEASRLSESPEMGMTTDHVLISSRFQVNKASIIAHLRDI